MLRLQLALLAALLACSCGSAPQQEDAPWESFALRGEVVDLRDGETKIAYVDHEEIPGFMGAMTMAFPVRGIEEFAKLTVGAQIEATVMARGYSEYYLDEIKVIEADPPPSVQ